MIDKIVSKLEHKNIAILGFGREGKATYKFVRKHLALQSLTIIDRIDVSKDDLLAGDKKTFVISGDNYLDGLDSYDLVIKSPGISLKDIDTTNVNLTSEIELLLEVAKDKVIGVTGTKGKSTTTSLIASILKENGLKVILAGNIGIPVFDRFDEVDEDTVFVLEMSSHQLEYLNVSPHIGVILNLFEDHLDHAGSVEHYHNIKMNMFKYQEDDDYMVYCQDNISLKNKILENKFKGKKYDVDIESKSAKTYLDDGKVYYDGNEVFDISLKRNLLGIYNFKNIMVAYTVSKILLLDDDKTFKAIAEFKPLKYRLELVGEINKVKFFVDTLATIPEATKEIGRASCRERV